MKRFSPLLPLLCILLLAAACDRRPDGVLDKEDMARLLADIHKAEIVAETNTRTYNDSLKRVLRQSVYARHGVTTEEVDSSLSWYGYNMEKYLEVYDRVIEILEKERDDARRKAGSASESTDIDISFDGDSVDVWTGERLLRLAPNMPVELLPFTLTSDRNWQQGDAYTLKTKLINPSAPVDVTIVVRYREGTDEYVNTQFNGEGWHELRLATDKNRDPREVYGYISSRPAGQHTSYLDSITLVRVRENSPFNEEARRNVRTFAPKRY